MRKCLEKYIDFRWHFGVTGQNFNLNIIFTVYFRTFSYSPALSVYSYIFNFQYLCHIYSFFIKFNSSGEVVGLFPDKVENMMKITKLTAYTASAACLKGVITRSQYLEARKPVDPKGLLCESVCFATLSVGPWSNGCKRWIWIPRPEFGSRRVPWSRKKASGKSSTFYHSLDGGILLD